MRGGAPADGAEAHDLSAIERGGVGRSEILGNEDGVLWVLRGLAFGAGENGEHPPADIAHIVGALREQRIAQRSQAIGVGGDSLFPGEGRALSFAHGGFHDLEEVGIVD